MSAHPLVERLADQHGAHLAWLRKRLHGRLAPDEVEDVLQGAYARALSALSAPLAERPRFAGPGQAAAWLRAIALNHACDVLRERHGRPRDGQALRPVAASLDETGCSRLIADVDLEGDVLSTVQRESYRPLVLEAIARLDSRHRQILQLRYGRDLSPAAIMVLVGLDRRQWDGRHTRALKAFGRALSRLQVGDECRQLRVLLKVSPAALLQVGSGSAAEHVASCLPCAAFTGAARFALAALPLPLPIESWRLDAAEVLTPPRPVPTPTATEPVSAVGSAAATWAVGVGAVTGFGAMALAALTAGALMAPAGGERPRAVPERQRPVAAVPAAGTRLADHLTPRDRLEHGAREMASRRGAGGRRPGPPAKHAREGTDSGGGTVGGNAPGRAATGGAVPQPASSRPAAVERAASRSTASGRATPGRTASDRAAPGRTAPGPTAAGRTAGGGDSKGSDRRRSAD